MESVADKSSRPRPRYAGLRVSRERYLDLEDDGHSYDMIDGVLHLSPSGSFEHGRSSVRFGRLLEGYLEKWRVGQVVSEIDVFLPDGGDVLRPDLSFLLNEHLDRVERHIHGAPDLVCEILSDSTANRDLTVKADRYLANGVQEYWIVDPRDKSMQLWKNAGDQWEKSQGERLESRLLPGFTVERRELFQG